MAVGHEEGLQSLGRMAPMAPSLRAYVGVFLMSAAGSIGAMLLARDMGFPRVYLLGGGCVS